MSAGRMTRMTQACGINNEIWAIHSIHSQPKSYAVDVFGRNKPDNGTVKSHDLRDFLDAHKSDHTSWHQVGSIRTDQETLLKNIHTIIMPSGGV